MQIGVVGVANGWSSERLADAVERKTGARHLINLGEVQFDLAAGRVLWRDRDLCDTDALIVKKIDRSYRRRSLDRLEILRFLQHRGVRVFSRPEAIGRLLNRLSCTVTLRSGGIPMPPTVVTEDLDVALAAVRRFETAVLKPLFTSKARGMKVVQAGPDARKTLEAFRAAGNKVLYIQHMVPLPGNDLGVVFLGERYVGSYARVAHGARQGKRTPVDDQRTADDFLLLCHDVVVSSSNCASSLDAHLATRRRPALGSRMKRVGRKRR